MNAIENLISEIVYSNLANDKIIAKKEIKKIHKIDDNIIILRNDLLKSYGINLDMHGQIYLSSIKDYITDKKDALVAAAWLAYSYKKLHEYNIDNNFSSEISVTFLKNLPLLSKKMMIQLWSASIENYCFTKIEHKKSLHYASYH